jgi:hypothetical protein
MNTYFLNTLWIVLMASACSSNAQQEPINENLKTTEASQTAEMLAENQLSRSIDMDSLAAEEERLAELENTKKIAPTPSEKLIQPKDAPSTNQNSTKAKTTNFNTEKPIVNTTTVVNEPIKENNPPKEEIKETPKETPKEEIKPAKPVLSHDIFDQLLQQYVSSTGAVDYDGFKKNKAKLTEYLDLLKNNAPDKSWSKDKEMAYWINLYNAFTISTILEKYPVNSITDLEGGKVWDNKKIAIAGETLTLNIIEKEKLLKKFKEPRVHFAVNCAAASCPPLLNRAWQEDNIQRNFEKQAKAFINNTKYNILSKSSIEVSQIFNWYAGDFGGSEKIVAYVKKYSSTEIADNAKVKLKEYDWTLNKK